MKRVFLRLASFFVALCLVCCAKDSSYTVINSTNEVLGDLRVIVGESHDFGHGDLLPGISSGYIGPIRCRKGDEITVVWKNAGGDEERIVTPVSSRELSDERGLLLEVQSSNVLLKRWEF